jgi:hypothetical protein
VFRHHGLVAQRLDGVACGAPDRLHPAIKELTKTFTPGV